MMESNPDESKNLLDASITAFKRVRSLSRALVVNHKIGASHLALVDLDLDNRRLHINEAAERLAKVGNLQISFIF